MKKKIIIFALCTGMLAGTTVQAQKIGMAEIDPALPDAQKVIFEDDIKPNTLGIYFIVKEGGDIDNDEDVYALKHAISDADGNIEFSFNMPEKKDGENLSDGRYDIYIKEDGEPRKKSDLQIVYASVETRNALLDDIRAIAHIETEAEKIQAVQDILGNSVNQTALEAIGCNVALTDTDTAANLAGTITADMSLEEFKDAHNYEAVKDDLENATSPEDKETYLEVINPVFDGARYNDIEDEVLTDWIASYFMEYPYTQVNYELANILYKFNTCAAEGIDDLFVTYAAHSSLGIANDPTYIAYSRNTNKLAVNRTLTTTLAATPAKTSESLINALSYAITNPTIIGGANGGNTGSGGDGTAYVPTTPQTGGTPSSGVAGFKDLTEAEWARTAVTSLANAGIVSGDENGNFKPNDYVTREEYVKMLVVAAGKHNIYATCEFKDVPKDAWYYSYVASAKQYGLTSGISEEEFGTGRDLTRQDMAVLSLNAKGDVLKVRDDVVFQDVGEIADYAKAAVSKLYMSGAVNGTGNNKFAPLGQATRAECAQIIYNLFLK